MKKTTSKKIPAVKKAASKVPVTTSPADGQKSNPKEGVKILGILHLAGNILSGGLLGIVLIIIYLLVKKEELSKLEKETCYEIINFNLSFIIYTFIAGIIFGVGIFLMVVLIGFILLPFLPIVYITWIVLMIIGFLEHLNGVNYKYPFIIRFIS